MLRLAEGLTLPDGAALAFLLPAAPICLWVALSDLNAMKIRNLAVLGLVATYGVVGIFVLPFSDYLRHWGHGFLLLIICFAIFAAGAMGAGDAKFIAAAAPFVPPADAGAAIALLATIAMAALVTHRAARRLPTLRRWAPHWASWEARKFPLGLALGPALLAYLALAAL